MAANELSFNQVSTLLNNIMQQATGKASIAPVNANEFVTVGQTALKMDVDPLLKAISQMVSRTVFATRPYSAKFKGLEVSNQRFGNITRKLNIADKDFSNDVSFELVDGQSVDMYKVNKPNVLQTNFYGANVFTRDYTIFKDQFDCAFRSPDELASFFNMIVSNCSDLIEQAHENLARATIANFIGGKILGDTPSVIHLLTEYNALTGLELTKTTMYTPENFAPFIKWAYGRINSISKMMTERTQKFHINVTGKEISRHTPERMQKLYLYAPQQAQIDTNVLSAAYNKEYLKLSANESVNFWQSVDTPDTLKVKPTYLKPDGSLTTPEEAITQADVFGAILDEEAAGYTVVNQWSGATPFNVKGGYTNFYFHFTDRFWNDFTENGVVFLLD